MSESVLTEVGKAHHHVRVIQEAAVLRGHDGGGLGRGDGLVIRKSLRPGVRGDGVVQVQHEHRGSVVLGVEVRPRTLRQPQDGQDLALHVPALLAPQPPLDEAGAHLVAHGKVGEGDLCGQHAATTGQQGHYSRQSACHHFIPNFTRGCNKSEDETGDVVVL